MYIHREREVDSDYLFCLLINEVNLMASPERGLRLRIQVFKTQSQKLKSGLPKSENSNSEFWVPDYVFRVGLISSEFKLSQVTLLHKHLNSSNGFIYLFIYFKRLLDALKSHF